MTERKVVRNVTCVNDLDKPYIEEICNRAGDIYRELREGDAQQFRRILTGSKCVQLFEKESTRTYSSFEDAFHLLGVRDIGGFRSAQESAMIKGDSYFHTIDTYIGQGIGPKFIVIRSAQEGVARWAVICAFRSFAKKVREYAKRYRDIPKNLILPIIFSGGDGPHNHPSQLLLDCATFKQEFGKITGINFGECNDLGGSRVVTSHIDAAAILDWKLHLCPFPDAGLNIRQRYRIITKGISSHEYKSVQEMLHLLDLLYVSRYQFNLRDEKTGVHASSIFDDSHPQINRALVEPFNLPVYHARPIDSYAKEISKDLEDHPLDCSGIQSDFGVPTRMAMCTYAIDQGLFSLEGIIRSLNPEEVGFYKINLDKTPAKEIEYERYTTARVDIGYVIDQIPLGCGGVMTNIISRLYPEIQIVLSINVRGDSDTSIPKDVIKLHVPEGFQWDKQLDSIVALFTEYTAEKSCRVSLFMNGHRVKKWTYRVHGEETDECCNKNCITSPSYREGIIFSHHLEKIGEKEIKICPFSETPQNPEELEQFSGLI